MRKRRIASPLYATAIYVLVEASGQICFASAGHPNPRLLPAGQTIVSDVCPAPKTKGPALGMRAGASYGQTTLQLQPGDTLLLFTDGLCEIFNEQDQEFGREQLAQAAQQQSGNPLASLLDGMVNAAQAFAGGTFQDDVCLVGMKLN